MAAFCCPVSSGSFVIEFHIRQSPFLTAAHSGRLRCDGVAPCFGSSLSVLCCVCSLHWYGPETDFFCCWSWRVGFGQLLSPCFAWARPWLTDAQTSQDLCTAPAFRRPSISHFCSPLTAFSACCIPARSWDLQIPLAFCPRASHGHGIARPTDYQGLATLSPPFDASAYIQSSFPARAATVPDCAAYWCDAARIFLRSFLLLQLLAFMRLLCLAMPLQRGCHRANGIVRTCRGGLRGAPLVLALAVCLPLVQAAPRRAFAQQLSRTALAPLITDLDEDIPAAHDAPPSADFDEPDHGPAPALPNPISPTFSRVRSQGWEVPVSILTFQRQALHSCVHTACMKDAADVVDTVAEACDAEQQGLEFITVRPQPCLDHPVLLSTPVQHLQLSRVPICVEAHVLPGDAAHAEPRLWLDYFDSPLRLSDVETALANEWQPGYRVYVAGRRQFLTEAGTAIAPGDLLRIVRPRMTPPPAVTLEVKLASPSQYFRRLSVSGFPATPHDHRRYCLLQPLELPRLVQNAGLPDPGLLDQVMLSHAAAWPGPLRILWPNLRIHDLLVRGRQACAVAAAFPRNVTQFEPVIVDSRRVCHAVQVRATKVGTMTLAAFLDGIGLSLPDPDGLIIGGTVSFDPSTRAITVRPNDVVVLHYRSELDAPWDVTSDSCLEADPHGVSATTSSGSTVPAPTLNNARERSPRSMIGGHASSRKHAFSAPDMWQLLGAIGKKAYLLDPVAAAVRRISVIDVSLRCAEARALRAPVVLQDGELPPPQLEVARPEPLPPPHHDPPGSDEDGRSDSHSFLPDLLRIRVAVSSFQAPTRYHSLWYEDGEAPESLLVRANILLQDDPAFVSLLPVDPQPHPGCLTLILAPTWWRLAGIKPLFLVPPQPSLCAFVQPAFPGQAASDFVPSAAIPADSRCALQAPARGECFLEEDSVPVDLLEEASLLCLREEASPEPITLALPASTSGQSAAPPASHKGTRSHASARSQAGGPSSWIRL